MEIKISKASDHKKHFVYYEIGCRHCAFCTCYETQCSLSDANRPHVLFSFECDERINMITGAGDREDDVGKQICECKEEFNAQLRPDMIRLTL